MRLHKIALGNNEAEPLADLPKAVEEYSHRLVTGFFELLLIHLIHCSVAPAISSNYSRAGVIVNFVTATGGDVEMLRSIECYYKLSNLISRFWDLYLLISLSFQN